MITISKQKATLPKPNSDDDCERICAILSPEQPMDEDEGTFEPPSASSDTLECYQTFLLPKLSAGLKLKALESMGYFGWEERFLFGAGSPNEYAALRKEQACCKDTLELVRLLDFDEEVGLLASVQRTTDKKRFTIPLVDLTTCNEKSKEYQLIDDYATWFVNFGPGC